MSIRKSCGPCNGNGWITDHRDECPVCTGAGHVVIDDSNGDYVSCGVCRGDGWVENRHNICSACGGLGKLRKT
jgi:DnaJ-class molecular chaperone